MRKAFIKRQIPILTLMGLVMFILLLLTMTTKKDVNRNSKYYSKENVSLYLMKYHELPKNYISYHSIETSNHYEGDISDMIIGGDTHWNVGQFTSYGISKNAILKECDISFDGYSNFSKRGILRLVYTSNTSNVRVFYTDNHYSTFTEITTYKIMPKYYITKNIAIGYSIIALVVIGIVYLPSLKKYLENKISQKKLI